jgi:hypothetical protein
MFQKATRDKFHPEEDTELRRLVSIHGTSSWEAVARDLPGRSPRQCRERWKHYLSGELGKTPWTQEENRLLFEKMHTLGPKWTRLAAFFPGRTDIEVKSHWMQVFARFSNLHVQHRERQSPMFHPTLPLPEAAPRVQFVPLPGLVPKAPTPHGEVEWFNASREPSFSGSRSYLDLALWD